MAETKNLKRSYTTRVRLSEEQHSIRLDIIHREGLLKKPLSEINRQINEALNTSFTTKATNYWFEKVFKEEHQAKLDQETDQMNKWNYSGKYAEPSDKPETEENFFNSMEYKDPLA